MEVLPIRRYTFLTVISIALLFSFISTSFAKSTATASSLKYQIQALSSDLSKTTSEYEHALDKLDDLKVEIRATEKKIEYSEAEADKYQKQFEQRIEGLYRYGDVGIIDVLLDSQDFGTFLQRFELITRISANDKENSDKFLAAAESGRKAKASLNSKKAEQQKITNGLASQRKNLESKLDQQKRLLAQLEAERKRAVSVSYSQRRTSDKISVATSVSFQSINGFVFPIPENLPHSYTNDWHAPRRGHLHQGTDIFAGYGSPAIAVTSGSVRTHYSGTGGMMVYLRGDDGNTYIYAHMSSYVVTGGHVSAGQVIAKVGDSGNARGSSPHIHFEVHPGGGAAVNPYPILRSADPFLH